MRRAAPPGRLRRALLHHLITLGGDFFAFSTLVDYDVFTRPAYGYGAYHAALQARALKLSKISVIEFGVAGGNGLLALEEIATEIERRVGVQITVYGFDSGSGLPRPRDHRDMPYAWQEGYFGMDSEKLRARLTRSILIIGDISSTLGPFMESHPDPIGFISFDLDYYSSTTAAFSLFQGPHALFLPRVFCYFDDVLGDEWQIHSEFDGELLAIHEFNEANEEMKIGQVHGLRHKRIFQAAWNDQIYVLHRFAHPSYCELIYERKDGGQLPLED